jgi:hypothetical protein
MEARRNTLEEESHELFSVGDTVKLMDSPLDKVKRGAKGTVMGVFGDLAADPNTLVNVEFTVGGSPLRLSCGANRFRFCKHPKEGDDELPDAENVGHLDDSETE